MSRRVSALKWSNTSQQKRPRETPGPNSLSGFEIVLHPCCVVVIHGQRCVVERSQQVLPDVPHLSGVLFQAHEDEPQRSEEHTSELQSRFDLVCRLLLEKKNEQ